MAKNGKNGKCHNIAITILGQGNLQAFANQKKWQIMAKMANAIDKKQKKIKKKTTKRLYNR